MKSKIKLFYSPEYVAAGHAFDTTRKAEWIAESLAHNPIPEIEICRPRMFSARELTRIHSYTYVTAMMHGYPKEIAESQGFPWDQLMWTAAIASVSGACGAVLAALDDGLAGSLSTGLHHARYDRGSGYCVFNGLALASDAAYQAGAKKILILDLDAHCGGGTYSLTGRWSGITHLDISVSDFDCYKPASPHTLDIVKDADDYLATLVRRLTALSGQKFDICIYNAGMDAHEDSGEGALSGITSDVLAGRENIVFSWCRAHNIPVAFVIAGGYTSDKLSKEKLVRLHRLTITAALICSQ